MSQVTIGTDPIENMDFIVLIGPGLGLWFTHYGVVVERTWYQSTNAIPPDPSRQDLY